MNADPAAVVAPPTPRGAPPPVAIGLSAAEAAERLARYGPNEVPAHPSRGLWRRVVDQLADPLILVLLAAAVLTTATGDHRDTLVILLVVVVNTVVGLVQQLRADRAVAALTRLSAPTATVRRDATVGEVPATEVVPGDLVLLTAGDVVPADGRLVEGAGVQLDESALTGESVPVEKRAGQDGAAAELYAGTVVTRGRGVAVVAATGAASTLGRIAALLRRTGTVRTPLQRRLAGLGRWLAAAATAVAAVVLVLGLLRGQPAELMLVTAVSLAVAAVPESLPSVVLLTLALGARRMAARRAIVRSLPAVETLGTVTLLATDKTGTLTEGRLAPRAVWTPGGEVAHQPGGGWAGRPELGRLLRCAVLCNDTWAGAADPVDTALAGLATDAGVDPEPLLTAHPRLAEVPFDADRKRMTTAHAGWDALNLTRQHAIVAAILDHAVIAPGTPGARGRRVRPVWRL